MLLYQGNILQDAFQKTAENLSNLRLKKEREHLQLVIEAMKTGELSGESISKATFKKCMSQMNTREQSICLSLRASFHNILLTKAKECIKVISSSNPNSRIFAYWCLRLSRKMLDHQQALQRICQNLCHDQKAIYQSLGLDIFNDLPINIELEAGDTHINGQSTTIITLNSGKK